MVPHATFDGIENHKRDCCANGGPVKPKDDMPEVPPWPQPSGVFSHGTTFHVVPFLQAVQSLYQKTVEEAQDIATLDAEHQAFATMFKERLLIEAPSADEPGGSSRLGHVAYFRLYAGIRIADEDAFRDYYMSRNSKRYLRLDCLRDTDAVPPPTHDVNAVPPPAHGVDAVTSPKHDASPVPSSKHDTIAGSLPMHDDAAPSEVKHADIVHATPSGSKHNDRSCSNLEP